ncbi:MAG TPA: MBL fold metallo-hydrolase [Gemmatimonadaceae bacterium]|jgi:glyoxylase-like metal-dependent hydrolase (beta-lactamase superfamily II)
MTQSNSAKETTLEAGTFPATWYAGGPERDGQSDFLAHAYNEDFYILRQAAFTNYEKPFLFLLFGDDKVLLLDTGAGSADVAGAVGGVIDGWLERRGRASIPLIAGHTHSDGDHVAGDDQFANRANTTLVGLSPTDVAAFYGLEDWPNRPGTYDLGGRVLDILPIPGHEPASIAVYDRRTGVLLVGDILLPGRLYVRDPAEFVRSVRRLVEFTHDKRITCILGCHIENKDVPFEDYVVGTVDQPNEHVLQLHREHLLELDAALTAMNGEVVRKVMRDFTIWPKAPQVGGHAAARTVSP